MSIDFTRPTLFRAILYFLVLYFLFRYREIQLIQVLSIDSPMMPLEKWMTGLFENHPVWKEIYLFLISLFCSFSIAKVLSQNLLYLERTFVPALIFPLVAFGYATSPATPAVITVAMLLVFAASSMMKSHKREGKLSYFLNASVALGAAPLFYAPAAAFILLLPVGFALFQQGWRSMLGSLIGYALPLFFCSYVLWGFGENFGDTFARMTDILFTPAPEARFIFRMGVWDYLLTGLYLLLIILAGVGFSRGQTKMRRRALRGFSLFYWMLFIALGMIAFPCRSVTMLPILAVPLAAVIPACFSRRSGWWPNLLYLLMIWSVLIYNLFLFFPGLRL